MDTWIVLTVAAALFQTLRFMLQKRLSMGPLSAVGATFARFVYSAPLVAGLLAAYVLAAGAAMPVPAASFWVYATVGGLAQILATLCVVLLFSFRNFAVGITLKKTEVVQTALVGVVILGEGVSALGLGAILIGLAGVVLLSDTGPGAAASWWQRVWNRAAGLGLLSGLLFAVSGVCYRGAVLQVPTDDMVLRTGLALVVVTGFQMVAMAAWLSVRDPGELLRVWAARRTGLLIGITSLGGSFCWFAAFSLQTVAYVFALGQIELVFSLLVSVLVFRETITRRELGGLALLTASIIALVAVT